DGRPLHGQACGRIVPVDLPVRPGQTSLGPARGLAATGLPGYVGIGGLLLLVTAVGGLRTCRR
ncbi:MAG: hypothetical protein ACXVGH_04305, partial [Mycobacteriales bacterium]